MVEELIRAYETVFVLNNRSHIDRAIKDNCQVSEALTHTMCFQGGLRAVVWNDAFQFFIMATSVVVITTFVSIWCIMTESHSINTTVFSYMYQTQLVTCIFLVLPSYQCTTMAWSFQTFWVQYWWLINTTLPVIIMESNITGGVWINLQQCTESKSFIVIIKIDCNAAYLKANIYFLILALI